LFKILVISAASGADSKLMLLANSENESFGSELRRSLMFIETTRRLSQTPQRHMADVAPPELGDLLRNVFYKYYAPLALQNLGIRQQYQSC
jgi:hypothetical protein